MAVHTMRAWDSLGVVSPIKTGTVEIDAGRSHLYPQQWQVEALPVLIAVVVATAVDSAGDRSAVLHRSCDAAVADAIAIDAEQRQLLSE
jgi:hypothetical protein